MKIKRNHNRYSAAVASFCAFSLVFPQWLGSETLTMVGAYPSPMGVYNGLLTTGQTILARDAGQVGVGTPPNQGYELQVNANAVNSFGGLYVRAANNLGSWIESDQTGQWAGEFWGTNGLGVYVRNQGNNAGYWAGFFQSDFGNGLYAQTSGVGVLAGNFVSQFGNGLGISVSAVDPANWAAVFANSVGHGLYGLAGNYNAIAGYFINAGSGTYGILGLQNYAFIGGGDDSLSGKMYIGGVYYGNGAGIYAVPGFFTSDRRLKENIRPLGTSLGKILALNPIRFNWKKDSQEYASNKGDEFGFVAQEVEKIIPELVAEHDVVESGDGKETLDTKLGRIKTVNFSRLLPFLAGAIQELYRDFVDTERRGNGELLKLQNENKELNALLTTLEARLVKLEKKRQLRIWRTR